jgi:hypothetical protein
MPQVYSTRGGGGVVFPATSDADVPSEEEGEEEEEGEGVEEGGEPSAS